MYLPKRAEKLEIFIPIIEKFGVISYVTLLLSHLMSEEGVIFQEKNPNF